jgi:hypothetical protein
MLYRFRWIGLILGIIAGIAGIALIIIYRTDLFGPGTWGTGGNMVAWILCGVSGGAWLWSKEKARHLVSLAEARQHHAEAMQQSLMHHDEVMALSREHHAEMLGKTDLQSAEIKEHVSAAVAEAAATSAPAAPQVIVVPPPAPGHEAG